MTLKRDVEISKPEKRITEIAEMVPHTQSVFNRYEREPNYKHEQ